MQWRKENGVGGGRGAVLHPLISSLLLPCYSQPEHPRAPGSWDSGAGVGGICGGSGGSCASSSQSWDRSRKSLERAWFGALEGALMEGLALLLGLLAGQLGEHSVNSERYIFFF